MLSAYPFARHLFCDTFRHSDCLPSRTSLNLFAQDTQSGTRSVGTARRVFVDALGPSMAVDNARRWSEVVPPQTALSFAAIWDPDDGLVTFSGPELLNAPDTWSASTLRDLPLDANEGRSQILTLDGFSLPFSNAMMDTAGLPRANRVQFMADALDEGQSMLDPYMRYFEERRRAAGKKDDAKKTRWKRQGIVHLDWSQLRNASAAMASLGNRILRPFTIHSPDEQDEFTYDGLFEEVPVTARTSTSAPMLVHLHLVCSLFVLHRSRTLTELELEIGILSNDNINDWIRRH